MLGRCHLVSKKKKADEKAVPLDINHANIKFIQEQPKYLQPSLRMFMSVDLVNSTAFKQKGSIKPEDKLVGRAKFAPWLGAIAKFYREFPAAFADQWNNVTAALKHNGTHSGLTSPKLWKANGDELIYVIDLTSSMHPRILLLAWTNALHSYRMQLRKDSVGLDLKSACWLAGFPLQNSEVFFTEEVPKDEALSEDPIAHQIQLATRYYSDNEKRMGILRDFVGPAIDTGFRLASLATPRKLIVSFDLALMLAVDPGLPRELDALAEGLLENGKLKFFFEGRRELKGVLGGVPYPVFSLDVAERDQDKFNALDDKMQNRKPIAAAEVVDFCEVFLTTIARGLMRPFILNDKNGKFPTPYGTSYMPHYEDYIKDWKQQSKSVLSTEDDLEQSAKAPDNGEEISADRVKSLLSELPKSN
jgi:hypothetical protein